MKTNNLLYNLFFQIPSPVWEEPAEGGAGVTATPPAAPAANAEPDGSNEQPAVGEGTPPADPPASLLNDPKAGEGDGSEGDSSGSNAETVEPLTAEQITLPEGVEIEGEAMEKFLSLVNNGELSRAEMAQGLVDLQLAEADRANTAATEAVSAEWTRVQSEWMDQVRALPGIGGEALPETLSTIKQGLLNVGATDETFKVFDTTGAGNHPEIIRVLHALTKGLVEKPPTSGTPTAQASGDKASRMFPSMADKET